MRLAKAVRTGMRGKDLLKFLMVARQFKVLLLVRHTNADSLRYVQQAGCYSIPAVSKARTADVDPPITTGLVEGKAPRRACARAGLVVQTGLQPARGEGDWCYMHGDYDLMDAIVRGHGAGVV